MPARPAHRTRFTRDDAVELRRHALGGYSDDSFHTNCRFWLSAIRDYLTQNSKPARRLNSRTADEVAPAVLDLLTDIRNGTLPRFRLLRSVSGEPERKLRVPCVAKVAAALVTEGVDCELAAIAAPAVRSLLKRLSRGY